MGERIAKFIQANDVAKKHQVQGLAHRSKTHFSDNADSVPSGFKIYRKASCPCGGGCPACHAKSSDLRVSQPNDPAEVEADRIADRVMRMSGGEKKFLNTHGNSSSKIHRGFDAGEKEEDTIHRKPFPNSSIVPSGSPDHVRSAIGSGGRSIDKQTRIFFESRFGYDLSDIRVHADSAAGHSALAFNARAYTLGRNVVFGAGEYRPETEGGRRLLAHEIAHVIQGKSSPYPTGKQSSENTIYRHLDRPDALDPNAPPPVVLPPSNVTYSERAEHIDRELEELDRRATQRTLPYTYETVNAVRGIVEFMRYKIRRLRGVTRFFAPVRQAYSPTIPFRRPYSPYTVFSPYFDRQGVPPIRQPGPVYDVVERYIGLVNRELNRHPSETVNQEGNILGLWRLFDRHFEISFQLALDFQRFENEATVPGSRLGDYPLLPTPTGP